MSTEDESIYLKKSLDNPNNSAIYDLTWKDIWIMMDNILKELPINKETQQTMFESLQNYRYIDNLNDLRDGSYIRWIHVTTEDEDLLLNKGAIFCNVNITDKGAGIVCKSMLNRKYFILTPIDEYIIFQKLSNQEIVILNAIETHKSSY